MKLPAVVRVVVLLGIGMISGCGGGSDDGPPAGAPDPSGQPQETLQGSNDPFLTEQWALANAGQEIGGSLKGTPGVDTNALRAWELTRGSPDVVVAVLDSGVAYDHPDLAANIWKNASEVEGDGIDNDGNGYVDDVRGWDFVDRDNDPRDERSKSVLDAQSNIYHGTAVASVIAATADNGIGMAGIAPGVRVMPLRVLGQGGLDENFAEAVAYARDNGAKIINLSVATFIPGLGFPKLARAIMESPGVLVIASAGNSGNDADNLHPEPCVVEADNVLCVAATDQDDHLAKFAHNATNIGPQTVDMAAPGANILVAQPPSETAFEEGFEGDAATRWGLSGTSPRWVHTSAAARSGASGLSYDSATAPVGAVDHVRMTAPIDLTGRQGCFLEFWARSSVQGGAFLVALEGSTDGGAYSLLVGAQGFSLSAPTDDWQAFQVPLTLFRQAGKAWIGFVFNKLAAVLGAVAIDDLRVTCTGTAYTDRSYGYAEGTSFAAPLTAGAAALAYSYRPQSSVAQVRNALLFGGVAVPELLDKVLVPVRLNAYRTLQALDVVPLEHVPLAPRVSRASAGQAAAGQDEARSGDLILDLVLPLEVKIARAAFIKLLETVVYNKQPSFNADKEFVTNDVSYKKNTTIAGPQATFSPELQRGLDENGVEAQRIGAADPCPRCPISYDRYGISFQLQPGSQTSARVIFEQLLRDLPSGFVGDGVWGGVVKGINTFSYVDPDIASGVKRPAIGSLIHIDIPGEPGGADIIVAAVDETNPNDLSFTVMTVNNPKPNAAGHHPVWGAREFRVKQDGSTISISTSGVDSPGNFFVQLAGTPAQALVWYSFTRGIEDRFKNGDPSYMPGSAEYTDRLQFLPSDELPQ